MRKTRPCLLVIASFALLFLCFYLFLSAKRHVRLLDEQEIYTSRVTGGFFWQIIESEKGRQRFMEKYPITLPANDFGKYYLLVSDGRKIRDLTYRYISKSWTAHHELIGQAKFDPRHYPHAMFIYRINKIFLLRDLP
jgi:hypothetical protein